MNSYYVTLTNLRFSLSLFFDIFLLKCLRLLNITTLLNKILN